MQIYSVLHYWSMTVNEVVVLGYWLSMNVCSATFLNVNNAAILLYHPLKIRPCSIPLTGDGTVSCDPPPGDSAWRNCHIGPPTMPWTGDGTVSCGPPSGDSAWRTCHITPPAMPWTVVGIISFCPPHGVSTWRSCAIPRTADGTVICGPPHGVSAWRTCRIEDIWTVSVQCEWAGASGGSVSCGTHAGTWRMCAWSGQVNGFAGALSLAVNWSVNRFYNTVV